MVTTTQSFYDIVSAELRKGTAFDSFISNKVQAAVDFLEAHRTWLHMDRYVEFTLDPDSEQPRVVPVPSGLKRVNFFRLVVDTDDLRYLTEVNPKDIMSYEDDEYPTAYWRDGTKYFWLDNVVEEETDANLGFVGKTSISSAATNTAPDILIEMTYLVLAQTMLEFYPFLRDEKVHKMYSSLREEKLAAAVKADIEGREFNKDESMIYTGERVGGTI